MHHRHASSREEGVPALLRPPARRAVLAAAAACAGAAALPGAARGIPTGAQPTAPAPLPVTGVDDGIHVPALVIGSGYGGAVAALRLAEAGVEVLVAEMGMAWDEPGSDGKIFTSVTRPDERAFWLRTRTRQPVSSFLGFPVDRRIARFTGVLDAEEFGGITVYQGRGVGGGSLVNGGMAVTPAREIFPEILPTVDPEEMYGTYFPRAEKALGTALVDRRWYASADCYAYSRLGQEQAERAGLRHVFVPNVYDWDHMEREAAGTAPRSALAGEVIFGNNHGKRSLQQTYLPRAGATGRVRVAPLHRVSSVTPAAGGRYTVTLQVLATDGSVTGVRSVLADRVFFAAGSVGTGKLLTRLRATGALPRLNGHIGKGWGDNGNVMCARANHMWQPTGALQSAIPTVGIDNWQEGGAFTEVAPLPTGTETYASLYLSITRTGHRADFTFDAATGRVGLNWRREWKRTSIDAARTVLDRINTRERTTYRTDLFGTRGVWGDHLTYHPLGGAVLDRATDNHGRLHGYRGLYVIDGSLVPGSTGVNPFVTITALAERNIERIIAEDL